MPAQEEISANQQRLYESSSLRDDLNDSEATTLLQWGEDQIVRLAEAYPDDFEQKARFLRQLIKGINRFVGQREFNDMEGQQKYMSKITMYLPELGWEHISEEALFAALPDDKADMAANLDAILNVLSPSSAPDNNPPPIVFNSLAASPNTADAQAALPQPDAPAGQSSLPSTDVNETNLPALFSEAPLLEAGHSPAADDDDNLIQNDFDEDDPYGTE